MKTKYHVSETEKEVMDALWEQTGPAKQAQILATLQETGKEWRRQTLNTFLSRLEGKELVIRENRRVRAACSRQDYNDRQAEEVVEDRYEGKIQNFVAAFATKNRVSQQDMEELSEVLGGHKNNE